MTGEYSWVEMVRKVVARTPGDARGVPPALENAPWVIEQEEFERRLCEPERHVWREFWKALVLATDLETLEALLDGESVPINRLDPEWTERFGRSST